MASLRGKGDFGSGRRSSSPISRHRPVIRRSADGGRGAPHRSGAIDVAQGDDPLRHSRAARLMKRRTDTTGRIRSRARDPTREGAKAVLDGGIERLGSSYLVTAAAGGDVGRPGARAVPRGSQEPGRAFARDRQVVAAGSEQGWGVAEDDSHEQRARAGDDRVVAGAPQVRRGITARGTSKASRSGDSRSSARRSSSTARSRWRGGSLRRAQQRRH